MALSAFAADLFAQAEHEYKMVFVVNKQLDMGVGKQCAQVAHAAIGLFADIHTSGNSDDQIQIQLWYSGGAKKIVCRGDNVAHLLQMKEQARLAGLPSHLVSDAGHTQIPAGSITVLAIFGSSQKLDPITGSLRLL